MKWILAIWASIGAPRWSCWKWCKREKSFSSWFNLIPVIVFSRKANLSRSLVFELHGALWWTGTGTPSDHSLQHYISLSSGGKVCLQSHSISCTELHSVAGCSGGLMSWFLCVEGNRWHCGFGHLYKPALSLCSTSSSHGLHLSWSCHIVSASSTRSDSVAGKPEGVQQLLQDSGSEAVTLRT